MIQANDALVLDASVAAIWHLPQEPYERQALTLLRRYQDGRTALIAPTHILYEVPSAIAVASRGKQARLTPEQGQVAIERFLAFGIPTRNNDALIRAAYAYVHSLDISLYDGLYVALSQQLGIPLVTADQKLYARIREPIPKMWIGDVVERV